MDKAKSQSQSSAATKSNSAGRSNGRKVSVSSPGISVASSSLLHQGCKPQSGGGRPQSVPSCCGCGIIVTKDTKALQCERCMSAGAWKCADCLDLSSEMYDYLVADSKVALRWFCDTCDKVVMGTGSDSSAGQNEKLDLLLAAIEKLMLRYENIEKELSRKCDVGDLDRVDLRIKELEEKFLKYDELEPRVVSLESQLQANTASESFNVISDEEIIKLVVQEEINKKSAEDRDMENRKRNVILFRVPEKTTDNVAERKTNDTTFVVDLLDAVWDIKVDEHDIERMYRLGRWTGDKTRPLLVTFRNVEIKQHITANLRNLSQPIEKFRGIGVSHDLHPKEREENKRLVEEAKQNHIATGNDGVENYKFLVVGRDQNRRVIKVKRNSTA